MPLTSDIAINAERFKPSSVPQQTMTFNEDVVKRLEGFPTWFELGAAKYRAMRLNGETAFPAPTLLPEALDTEIPSRDSGRYISCRLVYPSARKGAERNKCQGVVLHAHGGGWVLGDEKSHDAQLQGYADAGDLAVISVKYRLAPEDPFPAGPNDCIDVAEYLVKNAEKDYGGPLLFMGGESAGAHLSLLTVFHLLRTHPSMPAPSLILHYGVYDLSLLPSAQLYPKDLILSLYGIRRFIDAFIPRSHFMCHNLKDASFSPYYENLSLYRGRLPRALFTCGTDDALLDDSINMSTKWLMSGGEAIVRIFPGAPHGFSTFGREALPQAGEVLDDAGEFIRDLMLERT